MGAILAALANTIRAERRTSVIAGVSEMNDAAHEPDGTLPLLKKQ